MTLNQRFSQDEGLRAAAVFVLIVSVAQLLGQSYLLLSITKTPHDLPGAITLLDNWFNGVVAFGYQITTGAWFPLSLILLSIIAIALLERKSNKPDFAQ